MGFDLVSITSLEENIPSRSLQPFLSAKRLSRAQRRAMRRPPLTTRYTVQYVPSLQSPCPIRSIADGAQALDTFLATKGVYLQAPDAPSKVEPRLPPIKWSSSAQAPTRITRDTHSSSPPRRGENREQTPPASPPCQLRRPHNDLLHIVTVEGDPDRDSVPRPGPYTSLVPPTAPWNTHGKCMIGVHNHTRDAISPTLLSPERYK
jgi:hypothetical protein